MHFITSRASSLKEFYLFIYLLALASGALETLFLQEPFHMLSRGLHSGQRLTHFRNLVQKMYAHQNLNKRLCKTLLLSPLFLPRGSEIYSKAMFQKEFTACFCGFKLSNCLV